MNFNQYQSDARTTAQYPDLGHNMVYPALGLAGESGETVDKIKKHWRNQGISDGSLLSPVEKLELAKELGDVLWYVANIASEIGYEMDDIAVLNIAKLRDRQARGVIASAGDNR